MKNINKYIMEFGSGASENISYEDMYSLISIIINNIDEVSEKESKFIINFFNKKYKTLKNWINSNHNNELSNWMDNYL